MANNNFYQSKFKGSDIDESITYVREQLPSVIKDINDVTAKLSDEKANKTEIPSLEGLATEEFVSEKIAKFVDSAPETLDTLNELAKALGNDPNFATTVATEIGKKVDAEQVESIVSQPRDVINLTNNMRIESRRDESGVSEIWFVSEDNGEGLFFDGNIYSNFSDEAEIAYFDSEGNEIVTTYATKEEVGNISAVLDELHAYAQALIDGGVSV